MEEDWIEEVQKILTIHEQRMEALFQEHTSTVFLTTKGVLLELEDLRSEQKRIASENMALLERIYLLEKRVKENEVKQEQECDKIRLSLLSQSTATQQAYATAKESIQLCQEMMGMVQKIYTFTTKAYEENYKEENNGQ